MSYIENDCEFGVKLHDIDTSDTSNYDVAFNFLKSKETDNTELNYHPSY